MFWLVSTMVGKQLMSLTTRDIAGASPTPVERFTNKPPKEEVPGSKPKLNILTWNRPVMNLTTADIPGNCPATSHFMIHATRHGNPLQPSYSMASCKLAATPEPRFNGRDSLNWSDIKGSRPKDLYAKQQRDPISCTDIKGTEVGSTPRAVTRRDFSKRRPATSLDVHDITKGNFVSTRHTDPLEPQYLLKCESSLGRLGDPSRKTVKYADRTSSENKIQRRPSLETTNLERAIPSTNAVSNTEQMLKGLEETGSALVSIGPVERSKPGWRPIYSNKYTDNGVRMKDANLRSDDVEGTEQLPHDSIWTTSGGVWKKTARPRRGFYDKIPCSDVEGAQPELKKDSMHRKLGRQTDPGDPVYLPLDGIEKAGLLERDITSKTVNVRKKIVASGSIAPEQNAAMQIANGNWHDDSKLQATFKAADLRKTGTVSYPTFVQCLNYVGVAMPAKDAAALARQLDPNGTGEVNYSLLPSHLNQALEMRKQFELEETSRRRGILLWFFFCPLRSLCDLL